MTAPNHATPIILSTWSFGVKANAAGWPYLAGPNPSSLDAVEQACRRIESDPEVVSVGRGGCPDRNGDVSLDASIMLSPSQCGAVCHVRQFEHPISIARLVMEKLPHVMLAGDGADRFAGRQNLEPANLITRRSRESWQRWIRRHPEALIDDLPLEVPANIEEYQSASAVETAPRNVYHDTVGVLAMDPQGRIAGACSTSGLPFKVPGRVGDSAIVGHGLYVDPRRGGAVCTGTGELIMGVCGAFLAVDLMGRGTTPRDAAAEVLQRIIDNFPCNESHQAAVIAIAPSGLWSSAALRPGYCTAVRTPDRNELAPPERVMIPSV